MQVSVIRKIQPHEIHTSNSIRAPASSNASIGGCMFKSKQRSSLKRHQAIIHQDNKPSAGEPSFHVTNAVDLMLPDKTLPIIPVLTSTPAIMPNFQTLQDQYRPQSPLLIGPELPLDYLASPFFYADTEAIADPPLIVPTIFPIFPTPAFPLHPVLPLTFQTLPITEPQKNKRKNTLN